MRAGIAGAGLLGRLLACQLVDAGWQVTLFDSDEMDGHASCAMAAAGMLAAVAELERAETAIYPLAQLSLLLWPKILAQLPTKIFFRQQGSLVTAHPGDQNLLTHYLAQITAKLTAPGLYQPLTATQLQQLEPELTKFSEGYYFPHEAQLDNQQLLQALADYLLTKNVSWHSNSFVNHVKPHEIILTDQIHQFDMAFDCRGLGAQSNWPALRGVRGELIWLQAPEVNITRPVRLLHPRYSLYVVPRPNSIYLIGASEIESSDKSELSVRSALELLSAAFSVHSGFAEARIIKTAVNCRPALSDNLPKISYCAGFMAINGLYRHGFLIAPALLNCVQQFLTNKTIDFPDLFVEKTHANH